MNFLKNLFNNHDWILTGIVFTLLLIGTITIYGSTFNSNTLDQGQGIIYKQVVLIVVSLVIYFILSNFDYRWIKENNVLWILFLLAIGGLLFVRFFTPEISGTHRWINIGSFSIQPAEYAKIVIILLTSSILAGNNTCAGEYKLQNSNTSKFGRNFSWLEESYLPIIKSLGSIALILLLILIGPAFGNTVISFIIWLSVCLVFFPDKSKLFMIMILFLVGFLIGANLIASGVNIFLFLKIGISSVGIYYLSKILEKGGTELSIFFVLGLLIFPIGNFTWNHILKDYQRTRIEIFLNPELDKTGTGSAWQVRQSQIAIGSGRVFGRGFMEGTQSGLKFLPFAHTDFIFASVGEQFGFVGAIITLLLLLLMVLRVFFLSSEMKDKFALLATSGFAAMLLIQIVINIGMNLGKLPVTGITLPLVSYGGSSVLVTMISLGLVQNMYKHANEHEW